MAIHIFRCQEHGNVYLRTDEAGVQLFPIRCHISIVKDGLWGICGQELIHEVKP